MAYSDLDIDRARAEALEPELDVPGLLTGGLLVSARAMLRDRLREQMNVLVRRAGTTETVFYDTLQALGSSDEVYLVLQGFLTREALFTYWATQASRPGRGELSAQRRDWYDQYQRREVAGFVEMLRRAIEEDEITFDATRTEFTDAPLWAI